MVKRKLGLKGFMFVMAAFTLLLTSFLVLAPQKTYAIGTDPCGDQLKRLDTANLDDDNLMKRYVK